MFAFAEFNRKSGGTVFVNRSNVCYLSMHKDGGTNIFFNKEFCVTVDESIGEVQEELDYKVAE